MKYYLLPLLVSCLMVACESDKPRIAICGIWIESSTFSPAKTHLDAFTVRRGEENYRSYPFLAEDTPLRKAADWVPLLRARAIPGGVVTNDAYETLTQEILELLDKNGPFDGIFFDSHGAMSVENVDDPEGDLIERVREVVGNQVMISTSMDLHGNVSERLAQYSDLITCYRMAPHEDALESKERAAQNLVDRLESGKGKPRYKAWVKVPILLPGEKTSTRVEPAKSLYAQIPELIENFGIIDASIWMGYPWADEPRNHAVIMAVGDVQQKVGKVAHHLAKSMWDVRNEFEFVAPTTTLDAALETAIHSDARPFFISDMGDNPTAGGAGDVTWTLNQLLNYQPFRKQNAPRVVYASIPGPDLIEMASKSKVGDSVSGMVGALVDNRYAPPLKLQGKLMAYKEGDSHAQIEMVLRVGNMDVIVTKKRKPYHYIDDFSNLGIDITTTDIVVVKIGYLVPELYDAQKAWLMALTPGGVDQDLKRLNYKRISRPMHPIDSFDQDPDLTPVFIPITE